MNSKDDIESLSAVQSLLSHLKTDYDARTQQRGRAYAQTGAVMDVTNDEYSISATVHGSRKQPYFTCLHHDRGEWIADCSCPVEFDCKHAHAVGLVWSQEQLEHLSHQLNQVTSASSFEAPKPKPPREVPAEPVAAQTAFRQKWSPQLAAAISRPLTTEEGALLDQLAAVFYELNEHRTLSHRTLLERGLAARSDIPSDQIWQPAFPAWWDHENRPRDPWALWQYIALQWQQHGRAIPPAFASHTDLTAARQRVDAVAERQEIQSWKGGLLNHHDFDERPIPASSEPLAETYRDLRLVIAPGSGAQLQGLPAKTDKPWRKPAKAWLQNWAAANLAAFDDLPAPARALALALRLGFVEGYREYPPDGYLSAEEMSYALAHPTALQACVLADGSPFIIQDQPLEVHARVLPDDPKRLRLQVLTPEGDEVTAETPFSFHPAPLYAHGGKIWRGPLPLPGSNLPIAALNDPFLSRKLVELNVRLPASLEAKIVKASLRPHLRCWLDETYSSYRASPAFHLELTARCDDPSCQQYLDQNLQWQWSAQHVPPAATVDGPYYQFDHRLADQVRAALPALKLSPVDGTPSWSRAANQTFVGDFVDWHAALPPETIVEATTELRGLINGPVTAQLRTRVDPAAGSGLDWFDVSVELDTGDLNFTAEELRLLLKAKGGWVRLPNHGWQSLQIDASTAADASPLGLPAKPADLLNAKPQRYHALQLSKVPVADETLARRLRDYGKKLRAVEPPPLPSDLQATLRPYQQEGYHYLVHLATLGLGGVLADDMGLGKTVQALAWLLWLRDRPADHGADQAPKKALRALVVCPKSVMANWENEAARFAPALRTGRARPRRPLPDDAELIVINYTQLRLRAEDLAARSWDAVILDEGQNIKNPASATARAAKALPCRHRIVLSGTPIENRLLDLWSLFGFAQPGLLGTQADFKRLYPDQGDDASDAPARLAARVQPFMLRRTKGEVARDLPARTEEDLTCELEGSQRTLYDAELKRARQLVLGVQDKQAFDAARFNILQSLLRLRQICCDPGSSRPPSLNPLPPSSMRCLIPWNRSSPKVIAYWFSRSSSAC